MNICRLFVTAATTILLLLGTIDAQDLNPSSRLTNNSITAAASAQGVRFTAPSAVVQMRLEVYAATGTKRFDMEVRGGNVLDWHLLDGQAAPLADGTYLCVVTVKSLSGKLAQRLASVIVEKAAVTLQSVIASQMTPQQAQAVGPIEDHPSLVIVKADAPPQTPTVVAHDGEEGQLIRGRGALSFRLGDFYRGQDIEQMRLTAEGNLGLGIAQPQARLDVDGFVRATQGIVFPDGSVQYSASRKTFGATSLKPGQFQEKVAAGQEHLVDTSGTGTTGRISKWLDGPAGVLGDTNIIEVSGAIGINGAPSTSFRLDVNGSTRIRGSNPGFNLEGLRAAGNIWLFQTVDTDGRFRLFGQDNINPGMERLTISLSTGNVGIGATTPTAKLDVAGAINAATQYNLGGNRVLSNPGTNNLFAGVNAGQANTIGSNNTFVGQAAGLANTTGNANAFFGTDAGTANTSGVANSFFGNSTGAANTTGFRNSFYGGSAGAANTTGANNSFYGWRAGFVNTTGSQNTFFGVTAGAANTDGSSNSFFGYNAGTANTVGIRNTFFGAFSGAANTTSDFNSFFGYSAGAANTAGFDNSFFGYRAGETNTFGAGNSFYGFHAGLFSLGSTNSFFGHEAGANNTTGDSNSFFGFNAGLENSTGIYNTAIGTNADFASGNLDHATAIGADAMVSTNNTIVLGRSGGEDDVRVPGAIAVLQLGSAGSTDVCRNASNFLSTCSSSLRYKKSVQLFTGGLDVVRRLRPISFHWKDGGRRDVGFAAEEVAQVEPLFVTYNDKGEVEGVKYGQLTLVLVNAVKQQQKQITEQQILIEQQRRQLESLKRLICLNRPKANLCKPK